MNKKLIIPENYDQPKPGRYSGAFTSISLRENITPQLYLTFAIEDFESNTSNRSSVNAFANAKRAIHFQTEIISQAFGIDHLPLLKRDNFPKRIDFCSECGVVGNRILNKYNKIRNKIEHDYYFPQRDEVESIIDITELFLAATIRFIINFPDRVEVLLTPKINDIPHIAGIEFPINKGIIYLYPDINQLEESEIDYENMVEWQRENSVKFEVKDGEQYYKWVRFLISTSN